VYWDGKKDNKRNYLLKNKANPKLSQPNKQRKKQRKCCYTKKVGRGRVGGRSD